MNSTTAWLPLIAVSVILSACSSTPVAQVQPAPAAQTASAAAPAAPAATTTTPAAQNIVIPPYLDPNSALSKQRSFYFDFDVYSIKPEYASQLELSGKFLAANPKVKIKVEGNADERGSAEYNLALGQKRADAVTKALKVYGVADSQLESVSFGREKPKATGHDETSWAQNRRVDLDYPTK